MPHSLKQFQIDAFADKPFKGNPAAVIVLPEFLPDTLMQNIASENNLSETAFCVPKSGKSGHYDLRWFTPTLEINFCGHATIATAHALRAELKARLSDAGTYEFDAAIGALSVGYEDGLYSLLAPIAQPVSVPITDSMHQAFDLPIIEAFTAADNLYIVTDNPQRVRDYGVNRAAIIPLSDHGVGLTAAGEDYDCVSRFFVPAQGIDEDPVTGSAHAALGPYWTKRLGKSNLRAYQASARGGELGLRIIGDKIEIIGAAVTFMRGEIEVG